MSVEEGAHETSLAAKSRKGGWMFAALNVTPAIAWLRFFFGRAACDRNGLGIAFQAARPS
jgi:hypothetical protein